MKSNLQWMWSKLGKNSPPNHTHVYPFLVPGSVSGLAGGSNHHHTREGPACKKKEKKENATEEKNAFTADRSSRSFQLNKKLFNAFHKSDQTSPSLIIPSDLEALPHATPCQDSWENQNPNSKNNEEVLLKARHGYSACFPFSLRGDFKNYVLCYP